MAAHFEYLAGRQSQIDHHLLVGHDARDTPLRVSPDERSVHTYVCGVSGSGKSRLLRHLLFQDISKGHPVCLIDPMGDLYRAAVDYVAAALETSTERGFDRRDLADRYLFLDGTDDANPLRLNPLEPHAGETSEQQVDDLMKALERLFEGQLERQRRLRNVLRAAFMTLCELNRLPEADRPALDGLHADAFPLEIMHVPELLNLPAEQREQLLDALPDSARMRFHRQYWQFLGMNSLRELNQLVQSSWNVLQYLLADDLVLRVFGTQRSTFQPSAVLREGKSLFCYLPKNENLAGARFLGKYLITKLQHAAYRRSEAEWSRPYYLYLDEFHQFVDEAFADGMTNLRKFGLRLTCAHQSQSQPPFNSPEGQMLLRTITANSRVKILFRLDRPDAERLAPELFELSQQLPNFTAVDTTAGESRQQSRSVSRGESHSTSRGRSTSHSHGATTNRSTRLDDFDSTHPDTLGSSRSHQHNQGRTSQHGRSSSQQETHGESTGTSHSTTERTVYYSLEGERELLVNQLQCLPDRTCLVSTVALEAQPVHVPTVPDSYYAYVADDLPSRLLEEQRDRLLRRGERYELRLEPVRLLAAAPSSVQEDKADAASTSPGHLVMVEDESIDDDDSATEKEPARVPIRPYDEDDPFLD